MSDTKFEWTDKLAEKFAKEYRFSSSRINLEMFKAAEQSKEKDIPKDWEIVSFLDTFKNIITWQGTEHHCGLTYNKWVEQALFYNYKIHSVKKLPDGEIFTTGDTAKIITNGYAHVAAFKIIDFYVYGDGLFANKNIGGWNIIAMQKVKPKVPLFTTEDGVEIFDKNIKLWIVFGNFKYKHGYVGYDREHTEVMHYLYKPENNKYFYTEEKAKEYILQNKPIQVSYKEMMDYLAVRYDYPKYDHQVTKEFFQSKINP